MIEIGTVIENRKIISIFDNKYCLAKCIVEAPEEFVVWNIDSDLNGVHYGKYFKEQMDAEWCYAALCFPWFEDNVHINMIEDEAPTKFKKLIKEIEYAKTSVMPIEMLYEVYGKIQMALTLKAISVDEFLYLNHSCVTDGINNPKYFKSESRDEGLTTEKRNEMVDKAMQKAQLSQHQFLSPSK